MAEMRFTGGLNESDRFNISVEECTAGQNFLLDSIQGTFRRRPPQDLKGTATNGAEITSIMQLVDRADTITTLVKAGAVLYDWDGSTFTSITSSLNANSRLRDTYWSLDDFIAITDLDLNEPLYQWDGTSFIRMKVGIANTATQSVSGITRSGTTATVTEAAPHGYADGQPVHISGANETEYNGEFIITYVNTTQYTYQVAGSPATPATGTLLSAPSIEIRAKYGIVHHNRLWLFNIETDGTALPHVGLVSALDDPYVFDTATRNKAGGLSSTDAFFFTTPDLRPINGVSGFLNELIMSTENGQLFRLAGIDATDMEWLDYYDGSAAVGEEAMVSIGNDLIYHQQGGRLELLSDTDRSGDVAATDVSRFIPDTSNALTENVIAIYDQGNQRALFFAPDNEFVLVFDKNTHVLRKDLSPWMVWKTGMGNLFITKAAKYCRSPFTVRPTYTVYWGDSDGNIYDLNGESFSGDNGISISASRTSRYITELQSNWSFVEGRVQYQRRGPCDLVMDFDWGEEYNETNCVLPLKGPVISGDPNFYAKEAFYTSTDYYSEGSVSDSTYENKVSTVGFSAIGRSPGFFLTTSIDDDVDFIIDKVEA